ncbi:hypothetical protein OH687_23790 [Burkholderia anthina]|nr:hypothetical protein OH687_23790 [Burkholderia anthina]
MPFAGADRTPRMTFFEGYTTFEPSASRSILHVNDQAGTRTQAPSRVA